MDRVLDYRVWSGARAGFVALVARGGHLVYGYTAGWADLEAKTPMALDTRFHLASMTKPVTAVAAMILVEEGRLSLDARLDELLPSFRDQRVVADRDEEGGWTTESLPEPIRIRHLLTFSSGIGGYAESDDPLDLAWRAQEIEAAGLGSLAQRIERIPGLPLYERPGVRWRYGWSADVLARVVEVAAGEPFDAFLQRRIFDPLGMDSTSFPNAQPPGVPFAKMYTHTEEGSLVREPRFDSYYGRGWTPGGGGLVSTAPDYMRFALMLAKGGVLDDIRILQPSTVAEMTRLHVPSGVLEEMEIAGLGWGLGLCVVADADATPMPDHDGDYWWSGRFGTHFWIIPETETVVVVMQQTERNEFSGLPITPALIQGLAMP
jgi:CubicO group peptidase (beta-lactamase class C family)